MRTSGLSVFAVSVATRWLARSLRWKDSRPRLASRLNHGG